MADVTYNATVRVDKGYLSSLINANAMTATMNVDGMVGLTLSLTTATSAISTAALTSVGLAHLRNLSTVASATAQIGILSAGTFHPFSTLRAGEAAVLRLTAGADYAAKATAGTRLRVDITEG